MVGLVLSFMNFSIKTPCSFVWLDFTSDVGLSYTHDFWLSSYVIEKYISFLTKRTNSGFHKTAAVTMVRCILIFTFVNTFLVPVVTLGLVTNIEWGNVVHWAFSHKTSYFLDLHNPQTSYVRFIAQFKWSQKCNCHSPFTTVLKKTMVRWDRYDQGPMGDPGAPWNLDSPLTSSQEPPATKDSAAILKVLFKNTETWNDGSLADVVGEGAHRKLGGAGFETGPISSLDNQHSHNTVTQLTKCTCSQSHA